MAHRSPHQVPLSNAHWRKGNVQAAEMTLETVVGAEAAALPQPGSAPLQVPRAYVGKGWEPRGSPGISLPNCLNSVASGSWNPDQMLVHVSQVAPQAPILRECRAPSRGQGIGGVTTFWKPKATPRDGNRGPEQLSVQTQAGDGGDDGTARPLLPHPTLSLPS